MNSRLLIIVLIGGVLFSCKVTAGKITLNVDLIYNTVFIIQFLEKNRTHFFILSLPFTEPECPPLSQNRGRCGPSWGGRCNKNLADYAVYCNEENGWCGVTSAHKYAQSSDLYDWEPESCRRNEF